MTITAPATNLYSGADVSALDSFAKPAAPYPVQVCNFINLEYPDNTVIASKSECQSVDAAYPANFNIAVAWTIPFLADLAALSGIPDGATVFLDCAGFHQINRTWKHVPNAPTLTSPINNTDSGGLTPNLAGAYQAGSDPRTMTHVQLEVRRVSDNALFWLSGDKTASGATFSIPYAGTSLVAGQVYKWRARTKDSGGFYGPWTSYTNFAAAVNNAPTAAPVTPLAGAQPGTLTPSLIFTSTDPDTGTDGLFSAYQVKVRRVSDIVSFWDPGQVATTAAEQLARQASVIYAGTVLVNNTAYEWRVRVQDGGGLWSNYSSWQSFTPKLVPLVPTSLTPSGLQSSLTPTVSGVYNQGSGSTESDFQYEIRQNAVVIYQSGDVAADIATGQAYGTNNPGDTPATPPALAWGTSYQIRFRSKDAAAAYSDWSAWQNFNTNGAPTTPTGLSPATGATVGDTTPTLSWVHNDPDSDAQTEVEIELRKVSDDSVVTGYGPKLLTQATLTHDVTETLVASPSTEYKWRIRTKGTSGPGFGPWSAFTTFTVANAPTVSVTDPTADEVQTVPTVPVAWTFGGGSGTQQDYRVKVYESDQATVKYDSTLQSGTATSWNIPSGSLLNSKTYYVEVTVRDTLSQTAVSTKVRITTSWSPPATITGLTVTPVGSQT